MSDTAERCLFSAPFDFLPGETLDAYRELADVTFREVWRQDELEPNQELTAWVPNPGQSFTISDRELAMFPALRVIATPSTGRNHIDEPACARRGVAVFSLQDDRPTLDSITASAEFTFLLLLTAMRRLDVAIREVDAGRWRHREELMRGSELAGKQIGLVGLGRNGSLMARFCRAFGVSVAYYDPYVAREGLPSWPIERIFDESDGVVVCCALTPETTHMIGAPLLRRLKHGAAFVNTSRGEVVVESDLAALVAERPDIRVALDVLEGEVRDTHGRSPLLALHREGRIVVTPHIAGATVESQAKAAIGALNALRRFFDVP